MRSGFLKSFSLTYEKKVLNWNSRRRKSKMVKKYRKKPVVVEAIQWTGDNTSEIMKWIGDKAYFRDTLYIKTLEGDHRASVGDYIIKGIKGEFYPCKPDVFEKTYELVE